MAHAWPCKIGVSSWSVTKPSEIVGAAQAGSPPCNMKSRTRPADVYLRFLQLAEAIRGLPSLPPLDPLEERVLALVASARQKHERLSVRDLMARSELGAPATIHTRLKSMRAKGWIMLSDTEDARRKQVDLTQAAMLHFDRLSSCLLKAAQGG